MQGSYDLWLVGCSFLVAVIASFAALELAGRIVVAQGRATWAWLAGGSLAMGLGIWSMHFIGMLAFHLPIPLGYDVAITLLSVLPAILSSALVLGLVLRGRLAGMRLMTGAILLGGGIAAMHYTGMAAIPVQPVIRYDPALFAASIAVAVAVAYVALKLAFSLAGNVSRWKKFAAALVMGAAICAMHYTGMAAAKFAPDSICTVAPDAIENTWLAGIVAVNTVLVLLVTISIAFYDARLADQNARSAQSLQAINETLLERTRRAETAESELRESEARFRSLTDLSSDWYWEQDENLCFTWMSGGVLRKLGWDPDSFIGKSRWSNPIIVDDDVLAQHKATLHAHQPFHDFVYARRNPDGGLAYVSISGLPLFDADGTFRGYRGVGRDVTEQKRAEEALRAETQRLRNMVEHLPAAAAYLEGNTIFLNARVERVTGYRPHELPTLDAWFAVLYPGNAATVRRLYEADRAAGFPGVRVMPITHKNGSTRLAEFAAYGDDTGEVWLITDVTDRVHAETEILHAREQLRFALSGSKLAMFEWSVGSGEVFLSERWADMAGASPGPTRTTITALTALVHPQEAEMVQKRTFEVLKGSVAYFDAEHRIRTQSGDWLWIRNRGQVAERDAAGQAVRLSGTLEDISDRKAIEQSLRKAHADVTASVGVLEQRNREIALLSELSNFLLSCVTVEEACNALPKYCELLFPGETGALYLFRASRDYLIPYARWGGLQRDPPPFKQDECWALRRGRPHTVVDRQKDVLCAHLDARDDAGAHICVPMVIQGELLGLLWMTLVAAETAGDAASGLRGDRQQLAVSLADQVALALSNIRLRESLRQQTIRDALTGLYNRRFLEESLEREIARCRRNGNGFGVLMLDVDHFKRFNDTFGHDAGDSVLRAIAQALQDNTRSGDIVCRYGGEEFTVVLPDADLQGTSTRASHLLAAVRGLQLSHNGKEVGTITISIGLALFPTHGETIKAVITAADKALYEAKGAGRDRLAVADAMPAPGEARELRRDAGSRARKNG